MASRIGQRLRSARIARGFTQSELARRAKISRQALGAVESGTYQPNVTVALVLARELGESVDALFGSGDDECQHIDTTWAGEDRRPSVSHARVALGRVGGKIVAVTQAAACLTLTPACGILENARRKTAGVKTFRSQDEINATLLIAGCDPGATILADWLARRRSPVSAVALSCSSTTALNALLKGQVHAAGVHLRDPQSGEYNLMPVRRALRDQHAVLVNFARWELGLATASGNPLGIEGFADFVRPNVRIVSRESGSGARATMDEALRTLGISTNGVTGYEREVAGHLEVAAVIADQEANVGVTIRVAAEAYGLQFIPLQEERYDLVILQRDINSTPVKAMLEALNSSRLATEISQFCAYDTERMGQVIARLNS
jgi:molybdopterin molybdotransferase/putative molybdopterin biosynthesis protein